MSIHESAVDIEVLLEQMTSACARSAQKLHALVGPAGACRDLPVAYMMPKMRLTLRVALSTSEQRVRGVFRRSSEETSGKSLSTIELEIVAVPGSGEPEPPDDGPLGPPPGAP